MGLQVKKNYQDVLFQLECDARRNYTDIGKNVGLSQQTVSYAIKTMREQGILQDVYPLFDYTKFGYNGYLVLFRVNAFSRERLQQMQQLFAEHEMVAWVSQIAGGWDLMVFFLAPNASYFNKEFKGLISQHPETLWKYKILSSVVIHDMGRDYLNAGKVTDSASDVIVGGDRDVVDIKPHLREMTRLLADDPQASSVDMARELDVTPKTVIDRINTLEERELVNGYRPRLGIDELGIHASLLFVQYNNRDVDRENKLRDFCIHHPNATLMMKTFGDYDAVIRLESAERDTQREIIHKIREQYEDILLDYGTLEITRDIEKRYLPPMYFR